MFLWKNKNNFLDMIILFTSPNFHSQKSLSAVGRDSFRNHTYPSCKTMQGT